VLGGVTVTAGVAGLLALTDLVIYLPTFLIGCGGLDYF
jgi:hypothetical protein